MKGIPEGYQTVTPYLIIKGCADALEFYKKAFGAEEIMRMPTPDGRIGHAELQIGTSKVMLADEHPEMGALSPQTIGGAAVMMHLYVEDVDKVIADALAAGAKLKRPVKDEFYGDRSGAVEDNWGHHWHVATRIETLTDEEILRRMKDLGY
ncbi:MAG: VOC family protein [Bryobacterales bacterium]|nr:VOC family protein [Bryobacterales bacterium]